MFSSTRADFAAPALQAASGAAYRHLTASIAEVRGTEDPEDPAAVPDIAATWAIVHGLADLLQAGRIGALQGLPAPEREAVLAEIIRRCIDPALAAPKRRRGTRTPPPTFDR